MTDSRSTARFLQLSKIFTVYIVVERIQNENKEGSVGSLITYVVIKATFNVLFQAITFYWFITNMASIIIAKIVRTKILRQKLGIPELVKWNKDNMPVGLAPKKGFRETFRESKS